MGQLLSWQDEQLGCSNNGNQNGTFTSNESEMTQVGETFASMRIDSALWEKKRTRETKFRFETKSFPLIINKLIWLTQND